VGEQKCTEAKIPLGSRKRRWEDDIMKDLRETERSGGDRINLVQNRDQWRTLINTVINLRVP
jgi:hypothetical protein